MNDLAISVENLAKVYRIPKATPQVPGGNNTLRDRLTRPFTKVMSAFRTGEIEDVCALDGVSFSVKSGEVIGLLGRNGAGKSTLLKILSRVTDPTHGQALIHGRVGSLLEVGTGFHPELTGKENIYLSGAILGMRRAEIDRKFDEIVAFAEVERFLATPVKHYSSGMYVRLAFAVAAHLETEVLLVDEVLAVGDVTFQKKCLGKMSDVGQQGRTVLFVSHNMVAVQNLCKRAIWLNQGRVVADGPTAEISRQYLLASSSVQNERVWADSQAGASNEKVELRRVCVRPERGSADDLIGMNVPLVVEVEYVNRVPGARLHVGVQFVNESSVAFTTESNETDATTRDNPLPEGVYQSVCRIPGNLLNSGVHGVNVLFRQHGRKLVLRCDNAVTFDVLDLEDKSNRWLGRAQGAVHPTLPWTTTRLSSANAQEPVEVLSALSAR